MADLDNVISESIYYANQVHGINLNSGTGSTSGIPIYQEIKGGITSVSDYTGTVSGTVLVTTSANHGLTTGDVVVINTSLYYAGIYQITKVADNTFYFTKSYTATQTGNFCKPSQLQILSGSGGLHTIHFHLSAYAASSGVNFRFSVYKNMTAQSVLKATETFTTAGNYQNISCTARINLTDGDVIWLSVENLTDDSDITHTNGYFSTTN